MNIIVFGKGGREHALAYRFSIEKEVEKVFVYPGNPGMQKSNKVEILDHLSEDELISFIKTHPFTFGIVGPEDYMINGFADKIRATGLKIIAPTKEAAKLESSKIFSKSIMKKYNIPTAKSFEVFNYSEALSALENFTEGVVLKLSGLHAGKGVVVCQNKTEAEETLLSWQNLLSEGVLLEEKLEGIEVSIFYLCKEDKYIFIGDASDHKRIFDNDLGPNTGGMGCYSPNPIISDELKNYIETNIVKTTLNGMLNENIPFCGILFIGLMITKNGPYVLEYNVRFGDPETQTILPRIKNGFLDLFLKYVKNENFDECTLSFEGSSIHVVKTAKGYPEKPLVGEKINITKDLNPLYFFAGVTKLNEELVTCGGRVCGLTVVDKDFNHAYINCYQELNQVSFKGEHFRKDIAKRVLKNNEISYE